MRFAAALALFVGVFVALPFLAHRLKRRKSKIAEFAGTQLVETSRTEERRRSQLEDKSLLLLRILSVLALAALGASPFVRCSRVGIDRDRGASVGVAILLDDSMSMRATDRGTSRFARAKAGALELIGSLQEGDSVAVILASRPARVLLAATNDTAAARETVRALEETDRGTDLDGAMELSKSLVRVLPQTDRQIAVFSDLADGSGSDAPLVDDKELHIVAPISNLAGDLPDCGIVSARRIGNEVRVAVQCSDATFTKDKKLELKKGTRVVASIPLVDAIGDARGPLAVERVLASTEEGKDLTVAIAPGDALAADDVAPVLSSKGRVSIGVVADRREGTAKKIEPIERAGSALHSPFAFVPLSTLPDRLEEIKEHAAVALDDPPGFTPEERALLEAYVKQGGVLFIGLGHASGKPAIGSAFTPFLDEPLHYVKTSAKTIKREGAVLPEAAASFGDLSPSSVTVFGTDDVTHLTTLLSWDDGAPFLVKRVLGEGEVWFLSLPFDIDVSDVALRPGFLSMLDEWFEIVRRKHDEEVVEVGGAWSFDDVVKGDPKDHVSITPQRAGSRVAAERIGRVVVKHADGRQDERAATAVRKEMALRPRPLSLQPSQVNAGDGRREYDVSWIVALTVLALTVLELGIRLFRPKVPETAAVETTST